MILTNLLRRDWRFGMELATVLGRDVELLAAVEQLVRKLVPVC